MLSDIVNEDSLGMIAEVMVDTGGESMETVVNEEESETTLQPVETSEPPKEK